MPVATNRGVDLHYETRESDLPDPGAVGTVAFVNPAGFGAWVWGWQHGALTGPFETLVWDLPGTGRSDAPAGPYEADALAADFEAVLADAGVDATHVVGAGLGGMVAVEYARAYTRAETLTLFGAAGSGDAVDADTLETLFAPRGDRAALRASLRNAFAADLDAHADVVERVVDWRAEEDADRAGFAAQAAAMTGYDPDPLYEVTTPARVYHGLDDAVVPTEAGRALADDLPRGEFTAVEGGHLCFIEESAAVNDALVGAFEADGESG